MTTVQRNAFIVWTTWAFMFLIVHVSMALQTSRLVLLQENGAHVSLISATVATLSLCSGHSVRLREERGEHFLFSSTDSINLQNHTFHTSYSSCSSMFLCNVSGLLSFYFVLIFIDQYNYLIHIPSLQYPRCSLFIIIIFVVH